MEFTGVDIKRLYGERFFLVPESGITTEDTTEPEEEKEGEAEISQDQAQAPVVQAVAEPSPPPSVPPKVELPLHLLKKGPAIIWKLKPTSRFAIVLKKSEFTNRELTGFLKTAIQQAALDTAFVGFGILEDSATSCQLDDMPVPLALICEDFQTEWENQPILLNNHSVWLCPSLQKLVNSAGANGQLKAHLQAIKATL